MRIADRATLASLLQQKLYRHIFFFVIAFNITEIEFSIPIVSDVAFESYRCAFDNQYYASFIYESRPFILLNYVYELCMTLRVFLKNNDEMKK